MGISGLLPALKTIQKTKHLSEFRGQTIAVDAYVWLHRGVYSCATELATGKPTHRYVDYAMHRVRLLRHFAIEPYVVFDGGPLPAKRGTELERKQHREENLSRGKALVAQAKHSQARECFVKCIDVTPQMAYQFIKALKAENVQHVVAPYEADAQLAYLERVGLVSAILTEDSDLLVFGCRNVLFKLDHVASTVCHISRDDFGSVRSTALDPSPINLVGWNDRQFRAMAILSGCDYLPNIPGIGLKTANNLLRKWKTVESVVRAITLEGKKAVPSGYLNQFNLADKCFCFQRVYDPLSRQLVHLNDVEGRWDDELDIYVGEYMRPELATSIAVGDTDPVTREPIKDINPDFKPRTIKPSGKVTKSSPRRCREREKATGDILSFFGPSRAVPREKPAVSGAGLKLSMAGASSGKRRLGEVLDLDLANRRQCSQRAFQSKFFMTSSPGAQNSDRLLESPVADPSQLLEPNKENVNIAIDGDEDEDILTTLSLKANVSPTQDIDLDLDEPVDGVIQEDGYMSPLSIYLPETQFVSSPGLVVFTPLKKKKRKSSLSTHSWGKEDNARGDIDTRRRSGGPRDDDFDADPISSPISVVKKRRRQSCSSGIGGIPHTGQPLKAPIESLSIGNDPEVHKAVYNGPDLQSHLGVDVSETESDKEESELPTNSRSELGPVEPQSNMKVAIQSFPPLMPGVNDRDLSASKLKPDADRESGSDSKLDLIAPMLPLPQANQKTAFAGDALEPRKASINVDVEMVTGLDDDAEEVAMKMKEERVKKVAQGWRMRWALGQLKREHSSSSSSSATEPQASRSSKKGDNECKERRRSVPMALSTNRLRRNETNVTPLGKHSLAKTGTNRPFSFLRQQQLASSLPSESKIKSRFSGSSPSVMKTSNAESRQHLSRKHSSLIFFDANKETAMTAHRDSETRFWGENNRNDTDTFSDEIVEISPKAWRALGDQYESDRTAQFFPLGIAIHKSFSHYLDTIIRMSTSMI